MVEGNVIKTSWEIVKVLQERDDHSLNPRLVAEIMEGVMFAVYFEGNANCTSSCAMG